MTGFCDAKFYKLLRFGDEHFVFWNRFKKPSNPCQNICMTFIISGHTLCFLYFVFSCRLKIRK